MCLVSAQPSSKIDYRSRRRKESLFLASIPSGLSGLSGLLDVETRLCMSTPVLKYAGKTGKKL